ncbi:hypothetical protein CPT_Palo_057 [Rhizobium phage Palo]|uniref:Uncharacterized protein n=1 Tax=Rhizobium phage Palo TaxID=2767573 RepID=A0A7L8G4M8_9CAUD|nr:hypothetical protein CPT_Palo_057 [Rhizobium phage Palo]
MSIHGSWPDPVLRTELVDNVKGSERRIFGRNQVSLGTVPQRNHKVLPVK